MWWHRCSRCWRCCRCCCPAHAGALRWNCALNPLFRRTVCGGDFEGELIRSSFGITHSLPFVADRVRLLIEVEGMAA